MKKIVRLTERDLTKLIKSKKAPLNHEEGFFILGKKVSTPLYM